MGLAMELDGRVVLAKQAVLPGLAKEKRQLFHVRRHGQRAAAGFGGIDTTIAGAGAVVDGACFLGEGVRHGLCRQGGWLLRSSRLSTFGVLIGWSEM